MKTKMLRKAICLLLACTLLFASLGLTVYADGSGNDGDVTANKKEVVTSSSLEEMKELTNLSTYSEYILKYEDSVFDEITSVPQIAVTDGRVKTSDGTLGEKVSTVAESEACKDAYLTWPGFNAAENAATSVYLDAEHAYTWTFDIETAGLYYIAFDYYDCETDDSSISSIQRKLYINGYVPFSEASSLQLDKSWKYSNSEVVGPTATTEKDSYSISYEHLTSDGEENNGYYKKIITSVKNGQKTVTTYTISQDYVGNSMAPTAVPSPAWKEYYCKDSTGYTTEYFSFYFPKDTGSITLEAEREPVVIKNLRLEPAASSNETAVSYDAYRQANAGKPNGKGEIVRIEAEFPDMVSDSSVYATNDKSSSLTYPSVPEADLYNVIGENSYNTVGQWAAYNFRVTESGWYKFGMRFKQSALQGMYLCRAIKLAGGQYGESLSLPFAEAANARFDYDKEWQSSYIGDGNGRVFEFYFEEGVDYTVAFECSLGSLREYIQEVEVALTKINNAYLTILQYTGSDPDEYRDYGFLNNMPEVLITLINEAHTLDRVQKKFIELCGTNGSHIATLHTVALLLDTMGQDDGEKIAANMSTLKSYLGTLGSWINSSKTSSMVVDAIWVAPSDAGKGDIRDAQPGFFSSLWFEIQSFFYSFLVDYDAMGLTHKMDEDTKTIEVWIATGRDQSQIWRSMIDSVGGFTDSTGVAVTLKLVTAGTLLPSILSGKGPDVYIGLDAGTIINYAIRDAVLGISGNDIFSESMVKAYDDGSGKEVTGNSFFTNTYYTYLDGDEYVNTTVKREGQTAKFVSKPFSEIIGSGENKNFADAAMDTITLLDVSYGVPLTMGFSVMFYRMDVLAELNAEVPESWDELLALLPVLQANNMSIGLGYGSAIDLLIYQRGGSLWKYTDPTFYDTAYAGAKIDLDSNIAREAFNYVCRLYSDYSFPVSYSASTRFRTGEMPIIIGDYTGFYNELVVYATEINGMWEFCSVPGSYRDKNLEDGTAGKFNYDSIAGITATVILHGCEELLAAWQFTQWQTGAEVQANYGNKMVALIGPSAKYNTANLNAIKDLSWTQKERVAIEDQMKHLSSVVNYPGSYIIGRYEKFAFLAAVNDGADPVDSLMDYIDAINSEIERKRSEFVGHGLKVVPADEEAPKLSESDRH